MSSESVVDRWPSDETKTSVTIVRQKGKKTVKESPWRYPSVEPGSLTSATLRRYADRLHWSFLCEKNSGRRLFSKQDPIEVFPQTQQHLSNVSDLSVAQRAEQGAHFLRTYYPDVDIPSELIRDEIAADAGAFHELRKFDPLAGSMLEVFSLYTGNREEGTYLAFPMGESYCDLNVSPLIFTQRDHISLRSSAKPIKSFQTPIQQILSPAPSTEGERSETVLGVRTYAATSLLQVKPMGDSRSAAVQMHELAVVARSDVGDKLLMDMTLPTTSTRHGSLLLVNQEGTVYQCSVPRGQKFIERLYTQPTSSQADPQEQYWRIGTWKDNYSCLLMGRKYAEHLDLRAHDSSSVLYHASNAEDFLISIEGRSEDHVVRLVTSDEVVWIDERRPGTPLLGMKHGRGSDRTLTTYTRLLMQSPLTFLTSRCNGLVTVYDVSGTDHNLVYVNVPPYCLPPVRTPDGRYLGHAFVQHPADTNDGDISVMQLSESGSISLLNLELSPTGEAGDVTRIDNQRVEWPVDVLNLEAQVKTSRPNNGPLGAQTFSKVDLRPAYKRIFHFSEADLPAGDGEAVYQILDKMPSFLQDSDVPVEHILTTYDISLRSGAHPLQATRSDILTESAMNSVRGYRALVQDRIPVKQLAKSSRWHMNIAPFLHHFIPDMEEHLEKTVDRLKQYNLDSDTDRPAVSYRRESESREQLLLDLSLSSNVFAPHPFMRAGEPKDGIDPNLDNVLETMSRATEAMSLQDAEPPPVTFGFLRPVDKRSVEYYTRGKTERTPAESSRDLPLSLGVRLLLKDWDIGADPDTFSYHDLYEISNGVPKVQQRRTRYKPEVAQPLMEDLGIQSQRPPPVLASSAMAPFAIATSHQSLVTRKPLTGARSQEVILGGSQPEEGGWNAPPSSQNFMTSTQVLPGPHGGRPLPAKKKLAKKRIGGF
ncbi:predicted protein [Sparassis crispa]|uniref:RRN6 beta-propeller domain-containing protein n=1 Tax=Sparassis crispa TaxID=139825 RepID=A0A401GJ15_9APHY|nr:predicted protein [Sparassis crispa]GBE82101.1 predicted protein [Sparassis crispa]